MRAGEVVAVVPATEARSGATVTPAERWAQTLVALLAVDLVGAVPLVCDEGWSDVQREDVLTLVGPDHRTRASDLWVPGARSARTAADHGSGAPAARGEDLAWAGFTSGSTGRPRAVVRSRASWAGSFDAVSTLARATPASIVLVPGSLATSLYCFGAVHALALGAALRPVLLSRDLGHAARSSDVLHLTPAQLEAVLDAWEASGAGTGRTADHDPGAPVRAPDRTALVGGAGLSATSRRRAEHAGIHVVSYYGAAELSFVAVDPDGRGLRPFPGVEIDVRGDGEEDRAGAARRHGTVWVRSPWLASGYLAGATGPLRRRDGWASVGDLADAHASDEPLVLRGRGPGAISVGASTVLPEDVESVLSTDAAVADVVVLGTPHPRWGQVVTAVLVLAGAAPGTGAGAGQEGQDHDRAVVARLEALSRRRLSPAQRPRRWLLAPALSRTGGGKLARAAVADQLPTYRRLRPDPRR